MKNIDDIFIFVNNYINNNLSLKSSTSKNIKELRKISIEFVSASAHAYIFENIKDELTEEEMNVFTRGRNASTTGHRKNVDRKEHAVSSGYEAVLGYLYLKEDFIRLEYLLKKSIEIVENKQ